MTQHRIAAESEADQTALLLNTARDRLALADRHEAEALKRAHLFDADSAARSAHHFAVAEGLRGRARFRL